jgi:type 1 glutamine amidotransferase
MGGNGWGNVVEARSSAGGGVKGSMKTAPVATVAAVCLAMSLTSGSSIMHASGRERTAHADRFAVLVFSRTAGFRHDSIAAGIAAIEALGQAHGFRVTASEAPDVFTDTGLAMYRVVVFLNTTGNVLDAGQQAAFERFVRRGGGFVGVHAAADTGYDWPWYGRLVGTYFLSHPAIQAARLHVIDPSHPSTAGLPREWTRTDEWYNFRHPPPPEVNILSRLDEATYAGGTMGAAHPLAWHHRFDGGRAWYTAMGHTSHSYAEPLFARHLLGGIRWAAGEAGE